MAEIPWTQHAEHLDSTCQAGQRSQQSTPAADFGELRRLGNSHGSINLAKLEIRIIPSNQNLATLFELVGFLPMMNR